MNFQIERLKQLPQRPGERWQGGLLRSPSWAKALLNNISSEHEEQR